MGQTNHTRVSYVSVIICLSVYVVCECPCECVCACVCNINVKAEYGMVGYGCRRLYSWSEMGEREGEIDRETQREVQKLKDWSEGARMPR